MSKHVASYFRHGRTISRRAAIAHKNNEHPITFWAKELALDTETLRKMLVYVGIHHTGLRAMRTPFYRMANLKIESEYRKFFTVFHSIPATKKKFINYMSNELQEEVIPFSNKNTNENGIIRLGGSVEKLFVISNVTGINRQNITTDF